MVAVTFRVLVAGAAIVLGGPQLIRGVETMVNHPQLVMVAAELKAATGDTDGALRLLNRTNTVGNEVAQRGEVSKPTTPSCSLARKS